MKKISLRFRMLIVIVLIQIPFIALFLYYSNQVTDNINLQIAQSYSDSLSIFCSSIQDQIRLADEYLSAKFWSNESVRLSTNIDQYDNAIELISEAREQAQDLLMTNKVVTAITFHHPGIDSYLVHCLSDVNDAQVEQWSQISAKDIAEQNNGWKFHQTDYGNYFARTIIYNGAGCTVWIDISEISRNAQTNYMLSAPIVFEYQGEILTSATWVREFRRSGKVLEHNEEFQILNFGAKQYILVSNRIVTLRALYAVPYNYNWQWKGLIIVTMVAVMVLTFLIALGYIQFAFFKPLNNLIRVMRRISEGDISARAEDFKSTEFSQINQLFNRMLDKVEELKIEAYENKIKAKHLKLDALRLQIRRHFFLNCLKNIYGMAQSGEREDIQDMVIHLSNHLRYTLDLSQDVVPLRVELLMCQNYIDLQGIGQNIKPICEISMDDALADFKIPPVSILTLVENCCKYGMQHDKPLRVTIQITCYRLDSEEFINIIVKDNGVGFKEETLELLNSLGGLETMNQSGHVGLMNVLARMKMLLGPDCVALFSNNDGARVELVIPLQRGDVA